MQLQRLPPVHSERRWVRRSPGLRCATHWLRPAAPWPACRCRGSVSEKIFQPLIAAMEDKGARVAGGRLVSGLQVDEATGAVTGVVARTRDGNEEVYECDAVVLAISIGGARAPPPPPPGAWGSAVLWDPAGGIQPVAGA